jgi:hypothetical protein
MSYDLTFPKLDTEQLRAKIKAWKEDMETGEAATSSTDWRYLRHMEEELQRREVEKY